MKATVYLSRKLLNQLKVKETESKDLIPYRVHGEYCISVNNDDYSTAIEAFFRNDVSFQPE